MAEPKKVLWVSSYEPIPEQIHELQKMYGDNTAVEVGPDPNTVAPWAVFKEFKQGNYDDIVVVAPVSFIAALIKKDLRPLWSESLEENDKTKIQFYGGKNKSQGFRFLRFRRVINVVPVFAD